MIIEMQKCRKSRSESTDSGKRTFLSEAAEPQNLCRN